jgi:phosphoribosylaminoimidazolecarboxamide formyltransferase/IMP cyclohydrolase
MTTAIISVYDKTGIEDFASFLVNRGVEILSTGGTLRHLREKGIPATSIADYTGQEEILGGRVKTLHPRIFAGILARRDNLDDLATLEHAGIKPVDFVIVNLYPFRETAARPGATLEEVIEQIDIGGVALLRAAAKNFQSVTVVTSPHHYPKVMTAMQAAPSPDNLLSLRRALAAEVFHAISHYDEAIMAYLQGQSAAASHGLHTHPTGPAPTPDKARSERLVVEFTKVQDLRYGENPHQSAAFYRVPGSSETSVARARQLHGKELSYNNILDLDAALEVVRSFEEPACCIIKHNNPCGVARAEKPAEAYKAALECDPVSAFGGIIAFNREVDADTAALVADLFVEAIIAPSFSSAALAALTKKKNVRLLETGPFTPAGDQQMLRSVIGGLLVQSRDLPLLGAQGLRVVSKMQPTDEDLDGLQFAWRVAKFVKSNAIVYTTRNATVGIGAGQMSRIDSTNIAAVKARSPIRGAYMASDAFFPFRDNVDQAAQMGIRAIIQPGGSVRDDEVVAAADEHGLIMVFTGMRHFRH